MLGGLNKPIYTQRRRVDRKPKSGFIVSKKRTTPLLNLAESAQYFQRPRPMCSRPMCSRQSMTDDLTATIMISVVTCLRLYAPLLIGLRPYSSSVILLLHDPQHLANDRSLNFLSRPRAIHHSVTVYRPT